MKLTLQQIADKCAADYANSKNPLPELRKTYQTVFQYYFSGIENSGVEHSAKPENRDTLYVVLALFYPTQENPSCIADVYVFLNGDTAFCSHKIENAYDLWTK